MKLKSYFSGSVEAAMEEARRELGDDALLVNARPSTPETRRLGAYEVVFGIPPRPAEPVSIRGNGVDRLSQDVANLRHEIERMAAALRGSRAPEPHESPETERLASQELDGELIHAVAGGTPLEELFRTDATLGRAGLDRKIIALVGPPGAGKTTTLTKLAARYGLTGRRPAQILSADVYRIAAADQLRSLASILGIACDIVETPVALAQAIEEYRAKDLILIDTPGLAPQEMEDGAGLAKLLGSHPEIDVHLVLPATMKRGDLARTADRYSMFRPAKLLFTRLDETATFGPLVSEAARLDLPISFLATGQQIPDDLEPATAERLAQLIAGAPVAAVAGRSAGA
jgi:flagellar biosynthesis protein FlhF